MNTWTRASRAGNDESAGVGWSRRPHPSQAWVSNRQKGVIPVSRHTPSARQERSGHESPGRYGAEFVTSKYAAPAPARAEATTQKNTIQTP